MPSSWAASLGSGQGCVLAACPLARWPKGCNIILIPTNSQLASLPRCCQLTQFPRTSAQCPHPGHWLYSEVTLFFHWTIP